MYYIYSNIKGKKNHSNTPTSRRGRRIGMCLSAFVCDCMHLHILVCICVYLLSPLGAPLGSLVFGCAVCFLQAAPP